MKILFLIIIILILLCSQTSIQNYQKITFSKSQCYHIKNKKIKIITTQKIKKYIINRSYIKGCLYNIIIANVSFYNPDDPKQTDDSPGIMAWYHKFKLGEKSVAISQDLVKNLTDGDTIYIRGYGKYIVHDKMNKRYKHSIDIAISDKNLSFKERKKKAFKLGRKRLKVIWLSKKGNYKGVKYVQFSKM